MTSETSIFLRKNHTLRNGAWATRTLRIPLFCFLLPDNYTLRFPRKLWFPKIMQDSYHFCNHRIVTKTSVTQNMLRFPILLRPLRPSVTNSNTAATTCCSVSHVRLEQWKPCFLRLEAFGEGSTFTTFSLYFLSFFFRGPPLLSIWYNDFQCFSVGRFLFFLFSQTFSDVFFVRFLSAVFGFRAPAAEKRGGDMPRQEPNAVFGTTPVSF